MAVVGYDLLDGNGKKITNYSINTLLLGLTNLRLDNVTLNGETNLNAEFINSLNGQSCWTVPGINFSKSILFEKMMNSRIYIHNLYNIPITVKLINEDNTMTGELPIKYLSTTSQELLPELVFPTLSQNNYIQIILPYVERFGFEFNNFVTENWNGLGIETFGLNFKYSYKHQDSDTSEEETINVDSDVLMNTDIKYFSNVEIQNHIIFDIGSYIIDNKIYEKRVEITNFYLMKDGTKIKSTPYFVNSEAYIIWTRPGDIKGNQLVYYDYNNFMSFINKYKYLNNNEDWLVPTNLSGNKITVEFWQAIADKLNFNYIIKMFDWLFSSTVSNPSVVWLGTEFKYKQGEYFSVFGESFSATYNYLNRHFTYDGLVKFKHAELAGKSNDNNLKQNYYDLLHGSAAYDRLVTYDYLNQNSYSYDNLQKYTHYQITFKQGGI